MPVDPVAANAPATSSWANDVADSVAALEAADVALDTRVDALEAIDHPELHAASHATGQPDAVTAAAIGAATSGHTHTAAAVGAWAKLSAGGGAVGVTIHVGTTPPASPAEGDVWIKG
jgi:hypothetical protein